MQTPSSNISTATDLPVDPIHVPGQVTLDAPFKRGEQTVDTITVRKPGAGELRGANLTDLIQMDVSALIKVLPRVTAPSLTEFEVAKLDPADLLQLGQEVAAFLLTRAMKQGVSHPV